MDRTTQDSGKRKNRCVGVLYHLKGAQLRVYLYAQQMSSGGKDGREFFASDTTTSSDIILSLTSVRKARRELVRDGWLVLTRPSRQSGRPNRYVTVDHEAWVSEHPGRCKQDRHAESAGGGSP